MRVSHLTAIWVGGSLISLRLGEGKTFRYEEREMARKPACFEAGFFCYFSVMVEALCETKLLKIMWNGLYKDRMLGKRYLCNGEGVL